jgi:regulator of protease activity HflC (stomatin/prohibitin superfamily)
MSRQPKELEPMNKDIELNNTNSDFKTHNNQLISNTDNAVSKTNSNRSTYAYCLSCIGSFNGFFGMMCCCYSPPYVTIPQGSQGVILNFGQFDKEVEPGLHYINPCSEKIISIDMRLIVRDIDRQNVMTKDNLYLDIDCILSYRVINAQKAIFSLQKYEGALMQLTYTVLRDVIGTHTLQECLAERESIAQNVRNHVKEISHSWGVEVESMRFKDMHMSETVLNALSAAAIAKRNAEAKIISAKADVTAAIHMRKAADALNTPSSMQIRTLETFSKLALSSNTKIVVLPGNFGESYTKDSSTNNMIQQVVNQEMFNQSNDESDK